MERGAWQATVLAITQSWTRLSDFYFILSCQGLKANFFLPLNIIPLYRCTNFLIHISIEEHLGCFQFGEIVNNAAINTCVHIFVWP